MGRPCGAALQQPSAAAPRVAAGEQWPDAGESVRSQAAVRRRNGAARLPQPSSTPATFERRGAASWCTDATGGRNPVAGSTIAYWYGRGGDRHGVDVDPGSDGRDHRPGLGAHLAHHRRLCAAHTGSGCRSDLVVAAGGGAAGPPPATAPGRLRPALRPARHLRWVLRRRLARPTRPGHLLEPAPCADLWRRRPRVGRRRPRLAGPAALRAHLGRAHAPGPPVGWVAAVAFAQLGVAPFDEAWHPGGTGAPCSP